MDKLPLVADSWSYFSKLLPVTFVVIIFLLPGSGEVFVSFSALGVEITLLVFNTMHLDSWWAVGGGYGKSALCCYTSDSKLSWATGCA